MDPEEAYRRICDNVNAILNGVEEGDIIELAEAFEALDLWLKQGGFLPKPWKDANRAHRAVLEIHEVLFPAGDPEAEWSSDELPAIAEVLEREHV